MIAVIQKAAAIPPSSDLATERWPVIRSALQTFSPVAIATCFQYQRLDRPWPYSSSKSPSKESRAYLVAKCATNHAASRGGFFISAFAAMVAILATGGSRYLGPRELPLALPRLAYSAFWLFLRAPPSAHPGWN